MFGPRQGGRRAHQFVGGGQLLLEGLLPLGGLHAQLPHGALQGGAGGLRPVGALAGLGCRRALLRRLQLRRVQPRVQVCHLHRQKTCQHLLLEHD